MDATLKTALDITFYILSTLMGLCVGSFLNVCIYRLPRGNFFSDNRSFCPKCGAPIKAYDNIPLLSYIILGGRCRSCHERISPRYPIIEALNMILWIVNYAVFGMDYMTIIADILVSTMIVVAMVDIDCTEIPDSSIITIIILGLLTFIPVFDMNWKSKLIGAFCISVPMLIIAFFGGMGLGDVKLYFALGLLFGWEKILIIFVISMIVGAIVGVINMLYLRHKNSGHGTDTDDNSSLYSLREDGEDRGEYTSDDSTQGVTSDAERVTSDCANDIVDNGETTRIISPLDNENGVETDIIDTNTASDTTQDNIDNIYIDDALPTANAENITDDAMTKSVDNQKINNLLDAQDTETEEERKDREYEEELDAKLATGKALPFGPFIILASFVVLYWGDKIVDLYKSLLGF